MPSFTTQKQLLAVDLHAACGVALFGEDGRLQAYDRLPGKTQEPLKEAAQSVVGVDAPPTWLVSAGVVGSQAIWERAAMRAGVRVQRVTTPDWQQAFFGSQATERGTRQRQTVSMAYRVLAWSGLEAPQKLPLDVAQAICVGLWAVHKLGWLTQLPRALSAVPSLAIAPVEGEVQRLQNVA